MIQKGDAESAKNAMAERICKSVEGSGDDYYMYKRNYDYFSKIQVEGINEETQKSSWDHMYIFRYLSLNISGYINAYTGSESPSICEKL